MNTDLRDIDGLWRTAHTTGDVKMAETLELILDSETEIERLRDYCGEMFERVRDVLRVVEAIQVAARSSTGAKLEHLADILEPLDVVPKFDPDIENNGLLDGLDKALADALETLCVPEMRSLDDAPDKYRRQLEDVVSAYFKQDARSCPVLEAAMNDANNILTD